MCYYNYISNILILYVLIQNIISIQSDPPFAIMRIAQQIIARAWRGGVGDNGKKRQG